MAKKGNINVQTENIFPIIKQFLYSDHEIFLRELVSNAVEATQKVKTLKTIGELKTDISKFEFGEGSFDKGFYFFVPIQFFLSNYTKPLTGFGLRPIQRDGAQSLIHSRHMYGVTDQANEFNFLRSWDNFYD